MRTCYVSFKPGSCSSPESSLKFDIILCEVSHREDCSFFALLAAHMMLVVKFKLT